MGLLGHLSQQDKGLIEADAHPIINTDYSIKSDKKDKNDKSKNIKEK
jgi:hypothetical protein